MKKLLKALLSIALACSLFANVTQIVHAEIVEINTVQLVTSGYTYGAKVGDATITCNTPGITITSVEWFYEGTSGSANNYHTDDTFTCKNAIARIYFTVASGYGLSTPGVGRDWLTVDGTRVNAYNQTDSFYVYLPALASPCSEHISGPVVQGNGRHFYYCSVCGKQLSVDGCDATYELRTIIPATCTSTGLAKEYCSICGYEKYDSETVIPMTSHDVGEWIIITPATETTEGSKYRNCNNCPYSETVTIPKLVHTHTMTFHDRVEPTPLVQGVKAYYECTSCHNKYSDAEGVTLVADSDLMIPTIDKYKIEEIDITITGFTYGSKISDATVTVTSPGITYSIKEWSVKDTMGGSSTVASEAVFDGNQYILSLNYTIQDEYQKGYTDDPMRNVVKVNGTYAVTYDNGSYYYIYLPLLEVPCSHPEEKLVQGNGQHHYFCKDCNTLLHSESCIYERVQVDATCTTAGYAEKQCIICGYVNSDFHAVIDALGHQEVIDHAVEASCTETGLTEGKHCHRCGETLVAQTVVPAKGHNIVVTPAIEPGCITAGQTEGTWCDRCGLDFDLPTSIPALHHDATFKITPATLDAAGKEVVSCKRCGDVINTTKIAKVSSIKLAATSYTYDGTVKSPKVTVKDSAGNKLVKNTDYTVTYSKGRKNVGKYSVTIKGKGDYNYTKKLTFTIKPKATSITKLAAGSKKFTVTYTKRTTQCTGYQIRYSTSSKMSSPKTVSVTSYKTTSKTIKSLKAKKKYYVQVRTYRTVSKVKYYSAWCTKKYVTTKA